MRGSLPDALRAAVEDALSERGPPVTVVSAVPVGGGCINHGARVDDSSGRSFFLKWNARAPVGMFEAETDGLQALARAGALRVPAPIAHGGGPDVPAWLLMEHVPAGKPAPDHQERLGRGLARMHASVPPGERWGWTRDNWIGSLEQPNPYASSWESFWRDARLVPQLRTARERGTLGRGAASTIESVLDRVGEALSDVEGSGPHLLHGDLWSGNVYADAGGGPVVVDPAVYLGHGEVDLAMSELFGGFGDRFYAAYDEALGIPEAYHAYRRDLYQLYYLLVHVNLFGAGYEAPSVRAARNVLSALSA